jgi:hypothetical protein
MVLQCQIVADYESVKGRQLEWFNLRAQDAVTECLNVLHSMAEGFLLTDPRGRFDFGPEAFKQAKKSVKATVAGDISFWRNVHGEKYFQANVEALKRGVSITRVFIESISTLRENIDILEKQRHAGIEVYIVHMCSRLLA